MKKIALILTVLLSTNTIAFENDCFSKVSNEYQGGSSRARHSRVHEGFDIINPNEIATYGRGIEFGPFEDKMYAFQATGSIHSGWFRNVIIVSPQTCKIVEVQMVEDE